MTINEYQKLAMTTLNPDLSKKDVLINGVMGLCGESGECIDIVKRHLAQGHELNREELIKELEPGKRYSEQEINQILLRYHDDFCTLRREMIAEKLLDRENGEYWRI